MKCCKNTAATRVRHPQPPEKTFQQVGLRHGDFYFPFFYQQPCIINCGSFGYRDSVTSQRGVLVEAGKWASGARQPGQVWVSTTGSCLLVFGFETALAWSKLKGEKDWVCPRGLAWEVSVLVLDLFSFGRNRETFHSKHTSFCSSKSRVSSSNLASTRAFIVLPARKERSSNSEYRSTVHVVTSSHLIPRILGMPPIHSFPPWSLPS